MTCSLQLDLDNAFVCDVNQCYVSAIGLEVRSDSVENLLHTLFQLPLPEPMAGAVRDDPRLLRLSEAAQAGLWELDPQRRHAPIYRASMDSWIDVGRFWRTEIFQPRLTDWHWIDLPRPLHFLYLPLRLTRLVAKRLPFVRHR